MNQLGYPADAASKRAYLISTPVQTGATFAVKDANGATVHSAPIGADLGSWSSTYAHVYAINFGPVADPGAYTIVVNGPADATCPAFRIGTGQRVYGGALRNALRYYQVQRDGPNFVPGPCGRRRGT